MDNTYSLIAKTNEKMAQYIIDELAKVGITDLVLSHGGILLELRKGHRNYKELSEKIGKTQTTMTRLVRKLENNGYIEVEVDKNDKRNKIVKLSEKGESFIPKMTNISINMFEKQYQGFTQEEINELRRLINKLQNNF